MNSNLPTILKNETSLGLFVIRKKYLKIASSKIVSFCIKILYFTLISYIHSPGKYRKGV